MSRAGHAVRWTRPEVVLEPFVPARAPFSAVELDAALEAGAREWNAALAECMAPKLRIAHGGVGRIRQDGRSVVLVRTDSWCPEGAREREDCYDRRRAAITHLYPVQSSSSPRDGEIDEADIEIDAVDYRWSLDGKQPGTHSLRAIVAHELGHVLGLDHSCSTSPDASPGSGTLALPSCSAPVAAISIMYPEPIEPGKKPVLLPGANEATTLCSLYRMPAANQGGRGL